MKMNPANQDLTNPLIAILLSPSSEMLPRECSSGTAPPNRAATIPELSRSLIMEAVTELNIDLPWIVPVESAKCETVV
jgi:hypothetical protein